LLGDGQGHFSAAGTFNAGLINPGALAVGDFNNDGYTDVAVASKSTSLTEGGVSVLLNEFGTGFSAAQRSDVLPGTGLQGLVATDVNQDGRLDLVASALPGAGGTTIDNVFALMGDGTGLFGSPVPYLAGNAGAGVPAPGTSYLADIPSPLLPVTTFSSGGKVVKVDLAANGGFEGA